MGIALIAGLRGRRFGFHIEVIGFSEEEGVRFGVPFIGSRALVGDLGEDLPAIHNAIREFGLDPTRLELARADDAAIGFLEIHIEQGPVLEQLGHPVGLVGAIAGQSRLTAVFHGKANHAGTTPMGLRRDALAGAAEWVLAVERTAASTAGMVATVGRVDVRAAASNVIPGEVSVSLDARHAVDAVRGAAVESMIAAAREIAARRGLTVSIERLLDQASVAMDAGMTGMLERAVAGAGFAAHRMSSGAGHDAMIMARRMPAAMLFLRSPGGVSHHPDESVMAEDVAAGLKVGVGFLEEMEVGRKW
jgi:allantoate deiminase